MFLVERPMSAMCERAYAVRTLCKMCVSCDSTIVCRVEWCKAGERMPKSKMKMLYGLFIFIKEMGDFWYARLEERAIRNHAHESIHFAVSTRRWSHIFIIYSHKVTCILLLRIEYIRVQSSYRAPELYSSVKAHTLSLTMRKNINWPITSWNANNSIKW